MANIPLKRGMLIRHQEHIYEVTDFQEHHSGKQKPTVHVALRDVRDHHPVDRTLHDLLPIVEVDRLWRRCQYLYLQGTTYVFMDSESFEQYELDESQLGGRAGFLVAGAEYRVVFVDGRLVSAEVPDIVPIKVTITAAAGHSVGGASNVLKEATLENGLMVRVPLFVKTGDTIRVDTRTRSYAGKEQA